MLLLTTSLIASTSSSIRRRGQRRSPSQRLMCRRTNDGLVQSAGTATRRAVSGRPLGSDVGSTIRLPTSACSAFARLLWS
ncbi:MAG TPA: hypothetical protein VG247_14870 [Pseudonocardiaceae bacterium]|jgi:hypothetical protein|nr:hypothetical protein [Pseudonocardiaceae bacterium]